LYKITAQNAAMRPAHALYSRSFTMASTIAACAAPVAAARIVAGRRAQAPRAALTGAPRLAKKEATFSGKVAERVAAVKVGQGRWGRCSSRRPRIGPSRPIILPSAVLGSFVLTQPLLPLPLQTTRASRTVATMAKKSGAWTLLPARARLPIQPR
jgi:hypothetical protein